jgi:hypothetical protein
MTCRTLSTCHLVAQAEDLAHDECLLLDQAEAKYAAGRLTTVEYARASQFCANSLFTLANLFAPFADTGELAAGIAAKCNQLAMMQIRRHHAEQGEAA